MVTEAALLCTGDSCLSPNDPEFDPDFVTTKTNYIAKVYAASITERFQATIWYDLYGNWRNTSLLKKKTLLTQIPFGHFRPPRTAWELHLGCVISKNIRGLRVMNLTAATASFG